MRIEIDLISDGKSEAKERKLSRAAGDQAFNSVLDEVAVFDGGCVWNRNE